MELKDLAPWIAIAFTLALSIMVPVFTQIANNKYNEKQKNNDYKRQMEEKKLDAYSEFLEKVGSCIAFAQPEGIKDAGASIQNLLPYVSKETRELLNQLFNEIRKYKWDSAGETLKTITDETVDDFIIK